MKKCLIVLLLFCSQNLFSQNTVDKGLPPHIYLNFISNNYKPTVATVYISGFGQNVFSQSLQIPNKIFMWFRCDSIKPCVINVDYSYPDKKPLLVSGQFYNGDSIIVDMDSRTSRVINRKK